LPLDFLTKPRPAVRPATAGRGHRHAENLGGFFQRESDEITQFHQLGLLGIALGEAIEGIADGQQFVVRGWNRDFKVVHLQPGLAAAVAHRAFHFCGGRAR
jgi:hypothetical protein